MDSDPVAIGRTVRRRVAPQRFSSEPKCRGVPVDGGCHVGNGDDGADSEEVDFCMTGRYPKAPCQAEMWSRHEWVG